jgi:hypothetical protein
LRRPLCADSEPGEAFRRLLGDLDPLDGCAARAIAAEADKSFDCFRRSLEHGLDRAVAAVPNPTGHRARLGRSRDCIPEADALNTAVRDHAATHHGGSAYEKTTRAHGALGCFNGY